MTVPPTFRRNSTMPKILILHKANIDKMDIEAMQGFRVTRVLKTIVDLVRDQSVSDDILIQAVNEALQKGMMNRKQIEAATRVPANTRKKIMELIKK